MSGWQPIETAPRDGTRILIAHPVGWVMPASWREVYEMWVFPNNQGIRRGDTQPTHWMPLPPPPAMEAADAR